MNCKEANKLAHAYLDRELDAANLLSFEAHMEGCRQCRRVLDEDAALKASLQEFMPYYKAPQALEEKVLQRLFDNKSIQPNAKVCEDMSPYDVARILSPLRNNWLIKSLVLVSGLVMGVSTLLYYEHQKAEEQIINAVLGVHIRTVLDDSDVGIQSSDSAAIAQWFKARLDYAVKIPGLEQLGYQLRGAKLEYVQKQKVASIFYSKGQQKLNLFIWPSPNQQDAVEEMHQTQGYRLIYWCKDYMNYWVISDMDADSLKQVSHALH